ncbi:hypothetical protein V6N13_088524 [Hibiscus sabdariffa]|uniref:Uncharacterized protein n=1 Tax=Hibiscus sabdariffa TaxID=183260 RepID=A0ABR2FZL8_9ROSI
MDALNTMKAEFEIMKNEKTCMEALLSLAETAIEEHKIVISILKAMAKLSDDLLDAVLEAGVDENTNPLELDEETMKELVDEAMADFNQALNQAQSRWTSPADGHAGNTNTGGDDGSSGDYHTLDRTNISTGKEARGSGGGHKGGNGGGHA